MAKKYTTPAPRLSATTIAQIRKDARRYLLAGGGVFFGNDESGINDHIWNAERFLTPTLPLVTFEKLLAERVADFPTRLQIENAASSVACSRSDAAYLFGVCVGLESFTMGHSVPPMTKTISARQKKGGKR